MSDGILIRPFQEGDAKGVWDVIQQGTYSNVNASFFVFVKKSVTQIIGMSLLVAGYAWGLSLLSLLFYAIIGIQILYVLSISGALIYLYGSTLSDIKDIKKTYLECSDHHFWVAEYNGCIVGTIAIIRKTSHLEGSPESMQREVSTENYFENKKVAWLRRMAVGKKFRRLGIAKKLIDECVSYCRVCQYDSIFLITTEVHHAARSLYSKIGFKSLGCKPYKYMKGFVSVLTYEYEMIL